MKFHRYLVNDSPILDIEKLNESDTNLLLEIFNDIKEKEFPSILHQLESKFPSRVTIDRIILRVLGYDADDIDRVLDYLYPALAKEIQQLKALMEG